jgi:hypothetical protein
MGKVESRPEIGFTFCIRIKTFYLEDYMTDIDLSTVPLSALTAEIKRRRDEWEAAQNDLVGFGVSAPVERIKRSRQVTGKTGNPDMKAAALKRWAGWDAYKKAHPNATSKDYFKARRAGKA